MPQLPASHEKNYLDLLKPYISGEQKKFRRNTLVSSFIILSVYFLGKSLTEIRVAGLDLEESNKDLVLILAILMVLFWLTMFLIYYRRDSEIQKEQHHLLMEHVNKVKSSVDKFKNNIDEQMASNGKVTGHVRSEYENLLNVYKIYETQLCRTNKAGILNKVINKIELLLPTISSICTIVFLVIEYHSCTNL